ncbi:uncharacterized protein ARMOST_20332 [Armillaria ostoyae]|uniref:Uncharacterized protein n=1 Tax=Armillaria ostoyae TaxID=47428 RepID=A0A284S721_ARMOS|nr:uncharacterized protein ARMOST_20332 [Armillaria ostoyae]
MDIKFIGSGASTKAVLYYITDYITKSQLKTHIAYAALKLSVKKLGEYDPNEDEELSGQQVSSYLMDFEDHFKSHEFQGLYWTSFESYVNAQNPSPECMPVKASIPIIIDGLNIEELADIVQRVDISSNPLSSSPIGVDGVPPITELRETDSSNDSNFEADFDSSESESESDSASESDSDNKQNVDDNAVQIEDGEDVILGDEEIIVEVNQSGQLVQQGSRVSNYVLKEHVTNLYKRTKVNAQEDSDDVLEDEEDMNIPVESILESDWASVDAMLDDRCYGDFACRLTSASSTRSGPWASVCDLREEDQTWEDTFKQFTDMASLSILKILDNMQILHECKDSRDDHYVARRARMANASPYGYSLSSRVEDDFSGDGDTEEALLHHLQSLNHAWSEKALYSNRNISSCIEQAEKLGMFDIHGPKLSHSVNDGNDAEILVTDMANRMELLWDSEYEHRQADSKKSSMEKDITSAKAMKVPIDGSNRSSLNDGSAFREAFESNMTYTLSIRQDIPAVHVDKIVNIDHMIEKWMLNIEQSRVFRIIVEHSLEKKG